MQIVITVQLTHVDSRELAAELADEIVQAVDTLLRATDGVTHDQVSATVE